MVANDRLSCVALRLAELDAVAAREFVDDEEPDVVARVGIRRPRVPEADDEPKFGYDPSGAADASATSAGSGAATAVCARSASACSATRDDSIVTIVVSGGVTR